MSTHVWRTLHLCLREKIYFTHSRSGCRGGNGQRLKTGGFYYGSCIHETVTRSRRSLWSSDPSLESENGTFHFHGKKRHYIIDLQKTVKKVEEAYAFLREVAATGAPILFVGTKKQAQNSVKEEATRCNQFYVNERWLGGMLTNFRTIQTRIARLKELEKMFEEGTTDQYPKKEVILMKRELEKLEKNLGGIKDMKKIPGALFIIDSKKEEIAIAEAHKLHIPVIATVDTNCDPDVVDFPIPANDDAIRAVRLLASKMADAVLEGRQGQQEAEAAKEAEAEEAPAEEAAEQE